MTPLQYHRHEILRRVGIVLIVAGLAALLPAPPAAGDASVHEIAVLYATHAWWWIAGWSAITVGNTLRLIGVQGHPGLPWPLIGRRVPPEIEAMLALRRRARENRAHVPARPRA